MGWYIVVVHCSSQTTVTFALLGFTDQLSSRYPGNPEIPSFCIGLIYPFCLVLCQPWEEELSFYTLSWTCHGRRAWKYWETKALLLSRSLLTTNPDVFTASTASEDVFVLVGAVWCNFLLRSLGSWQSCGHHKYHLPKYRSRPSTPIDGKCIF